MESDDGPRERIVAAALRLLEGGGAEAVSTRAVSAAAGVQAPTIYRLFGDKQGLLDAVAAQGFAAYTASKTAGDPHPDPVEELRQSWDEHIAMGLAHPALYDLMYARTRPGSPAMEAAASVLAKRIGRIAEAGRLRVPEERAVALVRAVGEGTALTLIATPEEHRDPQLAVTAREAVIAAITTDAPALPSPGPVPAASALRAALPDVDALSPAELGVLREWLDRITAGA
ncbi:TetR family transcriptional regulator [Actinomycetospora sp. NBRC 106375]|uniref:TetR/AcrR family transcriptional regulator n=1 Tax=Actinomycetospora sp. NBRC 106375 TaxID=3032207 RepID=UPI0024A54BB4|nr:TetR/AcrR family transcriptional regulator [Actinomycetospora sp. NBRC 106375]GLZ45880.1 TetR family transcriptional regulator [Actinomycetospora sp. NBRC 106375]